MGVSGFVPREVARGPRTRKVCVGIKFEEENFPSLIQTGESASSNLTHPTYRPPLSLKKVARPKLLGACPFHLREVGRSDLV